MNPILIATLAGVLTAICWGTADWLVSRVSKTQNKYEVNLAFQIPSALIMIPILLIIQQPLPETAFIIRLIIVSALFTAAFLSLIKALSTGSVGIVLPLANSYALVTLLLSAFFIGVIFSNVQIGAILGIVLGAVMLSYDKNHDKVPFKKLHVATFFAICAALFWGVGFFLINTLIGKVSWQMLTGVTSTFMVLFSLLVLLVKNYKISKHTIKNSLKIKTALIGGVVGEIGAIAFYVGSDRAGSVVIPAVISASAPLVASALARLYDNEKLILVKRVGGMIVIAGIIMLNLA